MASQKKDTPVPASTKTTRPAILVVSGRPISGDQVFQIILKTTSTDPEFTPAATNYEFDDTDFAEILALKVVDLVVAGGYGGTLANITVQDLLENMSLGILFDRGVENPTDWTAG